MSKYFTEKWNKIGNELKKMRRYMCFARYQDVGTKTVAVELSQKTLIHTLRADALEN